MIVAFRGTQVNSFEQWGVYTFGCPRPGDSSFAAPLNPLVFRIVHDRDLVPHLPPEISFRLGFPPWETYRDVGRLRLIDAAGNTRDAQSVSSAVSPEVLKDALLHGEPIGQALTEPLTDHAPVRYAIRLWNSLVGEP